MYINNSSVQMQRHATQSSEMRETQLTEVDAADGSTPGVARLTDEELNQAAQGQDFDFQREAMVHHRLSHLYQDRVQVSSGSIVQQDGQTQTHAQHSSVERMARALVDDTLVVRQVREGSGDDVGVVGVSIAYEQVIEEHETLSLSAAGQVQTSDGRQINFAMGLDFERNATHRLNSSFIGNRNLVDPLMINLNGDAISISDKQFSFDLDSDGMAEQLNRPADGTGFLVFDRNGNGVIDDGSELFGPQSGAGFAELSELDDDGNGWIDEAYAAFASLQVMTFNGDEVQLTNLYESGVGALYTGSQEAGYDLLAEDGTLLGEVANSGMALTESGQTLFMQEFHYAMEPQVETGQAELTIATGGLLSPFRANISLLNERQETYVSIANVNPAAGITLASETSRQTATASTPLEALTVTAQQTNSRPELSLEQLRRDALERFLAKPIVNVENASAKPEPETALTAVTEAEPNAKTDLMDSDLVSESEFDNDRWHVLMQLLSQMREQRLQSQKQWHEASEYRNVQALKTQ